MGRQERSSSNGQIPRWSDVATKFNLVRGEMPEGELNLLQDYCRIQGMIARGNRIRGAEAMEGLERRPEYQNLEDTRGPLLNDIARFIRKG